MDFQEKMESIVEDTREKVDALEIDDDTPKGKIKKWMIGAAFASGAAAGALTCEVIIPGAKKLGGWVGSKFSKDKKHKDEPEEKESKEEKEDTDSEETADEKKPETTKKHGKKKR